MTLCWSEYKVLSHLFAQAKQRLYRTMPNNHFMIGVGETTSYILKQERRFFSWWMESQGFMMSSKYLSQSTQLWVSSIPKILNRMCNDPGLVFLITTAIENYISFVWVVLCYFKPYDVERLTELIRSIGCMLWYQKCKNVDSEGWICEK